MDHLLIHPMRLHSVINTYLLPDITRTSSHRIPSQPSSFAPFFQRTLLKFLSIPSNSTGYSKASHGQIRYLFEASTWPRIPARSVVLEQYLPSLGSRCVNRPQRTSSPAGEHQEYTKLHQPRTRLPWPTTLRRFAGVCELSRRQTRGIKPTTTTANVTVSEISCCWRVHSLGEPSKKFVGTEAWTTVLLVGLN